MEDSDNRSLAYYCAVEAFKIDEWEISSDTRTVRGVDDGIRIATIKMPGQKVYLAQPMNSKNDHLSQDRLKNELYLTRLLRNKNLLTAVAVFIDPCSFEISLAFDESIADQSLYGMLYYSKRVLVFDQILSIMAQIGNGVEFLHERQLFHNAISSSNIFLCEGGQNAKLGNFQRATKAELVFYFTKLFFTNLLKQFRNVMLAKCCVNRNF